MTSMAPSGHCTSHALQTRHSSLFITTDFSSLTSKTSTGHVSTHVPHPVHFSTLTLTSTMEGSTPLLDFNEVTSLT